MKRKILITEKLVLYFLLLGIGVAVIISIFYYYSSKEALLNRTFDQLTSLRIEKKNRIEKFFVERNNDVLFISRSTEIRDLFRLINNDSFFNDKSSGLVLDKAGFLNLFFQNETSFEKVILVSDKNCVSFHTHGQKRFSIKSENADKYQEIIEKIKRNNEIVLEDLRTDGKETYLNIGAPVGQGDSVSGFLILQINIESINDIMYENNPHNGLGESGESYLVGEDYLMRSTSRFHDNSVLNTIVKSDGVINALNNEPGTDIIHDYRDIKVLSSYSPVNIKGLNWVILAEIDFEEAMITIHEIRNNILGLTAIISFIIFIIAFLFSKRISKPIIELKNAAQNVGKGNYNTPISINRSDEFGELADSFRLMSEEIKAKTEELENERMKRLQSMIDGQETERQRLSRELHDSMGQALIALKLRLENLDGCAAGLQSENYTSLKKILDDIIDEARRISNNLMPAVLKEFGLVTAIKNLCTEVQNQKQTDIMFDHQNVPETLDDITKIYLFRISQEALNNIVKHSGAEEVSVSLYSENNYLYLNFEDNGKGFDENMIYATEKNKNGLINMRERVKLLGGTFSVNSESGRGTIINITVPIKNHSDE